MNQTKKIELKLEDPIPIEMYYGLPGPNGEPGDSYIAPIGERKNHQKKIPLRWLFFPLIIAILTLMAMLLASCGGQMHWRTLPVCVEAQTDSEMEVIDSFNDYYDGELFEYECDEPKITIEYLDDFGEGTENLNGLTTIKSSMIDGQILSAHIRIKNYLVDDDDFDDFKRVFAHELGHSLGHVEHDDHGLMKDPVADDPYYILIDDFMQEWVLDIYPIE